MFVVVVVVIKWPIIFDQAINCCYYATNEWKIPDNCPNSIKITEYRASFFFSVKFTINICFISINLGDGGTRQVVESGYGENLMIYGKNLMIYGENLLIFPDPLEDFILMLFISLAISNGFNIRLFVISCGILNPRLEAND